MIGKTTSWHEEGKAKRSQEDEFRWNQVKRGFHPIPSHPIPSHPIQSQLTLLHPTFLSISSSIPIPSLPFPSSPLLSYTLPNPPPILLSPPLLSSPTPSPIHLLSSPSILSPTCWWGAEKANTSFTVGYCCTASSISKGEIVSPPLLMISFDRPEKRWVGWCWSECVYVCECVFVCIYVCVCVCLCVCVLHRWKSVDLNSLFQTEWLKQDGWQQCSGHYTQQIRTIRLYKHRSMHNIMYEEIPDMKRYPSLSRLPMSPVLNHPCSPSVEQVQVQVQVHT